MIASFAARLHLLHGSGDMQRCDSFVAARDEHAFSLTGWHRGFQGTARAIKPATAVAIRKHCPPSLRCRSSGNLALTSPALRALCSGFALPGCAQCATNYYAYPVCKYCYASQSCNNHGSCDVNTGNCVCTSLDCVACCFRPSVVVRCVLLNLRCRSCADSWIILCRPTRVWRHRLRRMVRASPVSSATNPNSVFFVAVCTFAFHSTAPLATSAIRT